MRQTGAKRLCRAQYQVNSEAEQTLFSAAKYRLAEIHYPLITFCLSRLPYVADMNAAMSMVAKHYLENTVKEDSNAKALEATEKVYSIAVNLNKDLNKGFDFWDHVMKGIKVLKEAKSFEETCNMFLEADAWLTPRRLP
jgi:hypothetical protein